MRPLSAVTLAFLFSCSRAPVSVGTPTRDLAPAQTHFPQTADTSSPAHRPLPPNACPSLLEAALKLPPFDTSAISAPLPPLEDSKSTLSSFHEALLALARGLRKEPIRIGIYGDSNMTQDGISGGMRRVLQEKFGDAGHGYVALGRAWPWYLHLDVRHAAQERAWTAYSTSTNPVADRIHGFANMAFETKRPGAFTWVRTAEDDAPVGKKVERFDLYYLEGPRLGSFEVTIDGEAQGGPISTRAERVSAGFREFSVADGPHRFELRAVGDHPIRVFGVTLERALPGIVVDSLGTGALNYEQMTRVEDTTRAAMLAHRHYDLVIFHLGANIFGRSESLTNGWTKEVIDAHRRAVPGVPVLLLSPADIDKSKDDTKSDPRIVALVGQLRRAADLSDAAYWDFWSAMGGHMSMWHLRKQALASSDLIHLVRKSAAMMGERMAHALVDASKHYLEAHPDAGCWRAR